MTTPTAPATSSGSPVSDAARLVRVAFSPGKVFAEMADRPPWWGPFIVVAVLNAGMSLLLRPFQTRVLQIVSERLGRPAPEPTAARAILGIVAGSIGLLVTFLIVAGVLYVLASVFGGQTTYRKMLNVAVFAYPLSILKQLVTWAVLANRGVAAITGPQDVIVPLGLNSLLLSPDSQVSNFTRLFLAGIGPLQIWELVIVAVGLSVMAKMRRGQAWTAAIIYFLLVLLVLSVIGAFGQSLLPKAN